jgi:hypothetical protein
VQLLQATRKALTSEGLLGCAGDLGQKRLKSWPQITDVDICRPPLLVDHAGKMGRSPAGRLRNERESLTQRTVPLKSTGSYPYLSRSWLPMVPDIRVIDTNDN